MSKGGGHGHGVSGYTHTQAQLDDYANQHNPNNDAYQANLDNKGHRHCVGALIFLLAF